MPGMNGVGERMCSWGASVGVYRVPSLPQRFFPFLVFLPGSQFWVTTQRTEASERCGLQGSYILRVEAEKLTLLTLGAQSQILEPLLFWPYTLLRRYGRDKVQGLSGRMIVREGVG